MNNNIKKLLKIIIPLIVVVIIGAGAFGGYKVISGTPEKTAKKYCDYLANKEYDKSYELLYSKDDDFLSEEIFEASFQDVDFTGYTMKELDANSFKYFGVEMSESAKNYSVYEVQANGNTYKMAVPKNASGIFKDYKIFVGDGIVSNWDIKVPKGTEVYIGDKQVTNVIDADKALGNDVYESETYRIDNIYNGSYNVTFKVDGAEDIVQNSVKPGDKITTKFKPTEEFSDQLKNQVKEFVTTYYNNGDVSGLVTSDSRMSEIQKDDVKLASLMKETLNNDLVIGNIKIDDGFHATADVSFSLTGSVLGETYNDKKQKTVYFKKENDKWLICKFI